MDRGTRIQSFPYNGWWPRIKCPVARFSSLTIFFQGIREFFLKCFCRVLEPANLDGDFIDQSDVFYGAATTMGFFSPKKFDDIWSLTSGFFLILSSSQVWSVESLSFRGIFSLLFIRSIHSRQTVK